MHLRLGYGIAALGVLLVVSGCSDDGVPQADSSSTGQDDGSTGASVTTTATTGASETMSTSSEPSTTGTPTTSQGTTDGPSDTTEAPSDTSDGSSSSGAPGTDGSSSSDGSSSDDESSSTGEPAVGECTVPGDCELLDDCCNCLALGPDDVAPDCEIAVCEQTACAALEGAAEVTCENESCELEPVSCNALLVFCDQDAPVCPLGTIPGVDPDAGCWTGACVPLAACDVVPSCGACEPSEVCVTTASQIGQWYACEPIDPSCNGTPSCACLPQACESPFDTCSDQGPGLDCSCPVC